MIDVRPEIALVFGTEGAMWAAEGRRLAALIQQVPLQNVRVLVALTASRAIVPAIVMDQAAAAAADAGMIIVAAGRVPRRTVEPGTTLRRQRCRHVARSRRRRRRRRRIRAPRDAPRALAGPTEAGEETCKRRKQTCSTVRLVLRSVGCTCAVPPIQAGTAYGYSLQRRGPCQQKKKTFKISSLATTSIWHRDRGMWETTFEDGNNCPFIGGPSRELSS